MKTALKKSATVGGPTPFVIPAKAGIQAIYSILTQWDDTSNMVLSAARNYMTSWIPAFATFNNILVRLPGYAALFERVSAQLNKDTE